MKTKKYLIIGSNSFLGNNLSKKLYDNGDTVLGVYNKNINNLYSKIEHITIIELEALNDEYDTVYIISAFVSNKNSINVEEKLFEVNVKLVDTICNQFKKAKIVYCSSVSVYKETELLITEYSDVEPPSKYGQSKLNGEAIVKKHPKYAIVRISSMYGVNMKVETFLPLIVKNALETKEITLYGDGSREQNYIHVKDVANYLISASNHASNDVFLAVQTYSISNKSIAEYIKEIVPGTKITFKGLDESKSYLYNNSKTNNILGIEPKENIKDALIHLIKWMKKES